MSFQSSSWDRKVVSMGSINKRVIQSFLLHLNASLMHWLKHTPSDESLLLNTHNALSGANLRAVNWWPWMAQRSRHRQWPDESFHSFWSFQFEYNANLTVKSELPSKRNIAPRIRIRVFLSILCSLSAVVPFCLPCRCVWFVFSYSSSHLIPHLHLIVSPVFLLHLNPLLH